MLCYINRHQKEHFPPRKELVDFPPTQHLSAVSSACAITRLMTCQSWIGLSFIMPFYTGEKLQHNADSGGPVPETQVGRWDGEERRGGNSGGGMGVARLRRQPCWPSVLSPGLL